MSVDSIFDPVFATPMDQLQKGILDVLRYMKQDSANDIYLVDLYKGIPFEERMDKIIRVVEEAKFDNSFRSVLESASVYELTNANTVRGANGGTRSKRHRATRGMSGGVNKRAVLLNVLLIIGQWFAFQKVFKNAASKVPILENGSINKDPSKYNFLINTDSIKLTTVDSHIAILSGMLVFMMYTAALLMEQFKPQTREKVNRIEVIVNNTRRSGGAMNLYQYFQKIFRFISSIPMNTVQQSAIQCLQTLHNEHPENPTIKKLFDEVRALSFEGQLGAFLQGKIQEGMIQEGGGLRTILLTIVFFIIGTSHTILLYSRANRIDNEAYAYVITAALFYFSMVAITSYTIIRGDAGWANNDELINHAITKLIFKVPSLDANERKQRIEDIDKEFGEIVEKIQSLPRSAFEEKDCFDPSLGDEIVQDTTTTRFYLYNKDYKLIRVLCLDEESFDHYFPKSIDVPKHASITLDDFQRNIDAAPEHEKDLMQEELNRMQRETVHCNERVVYRCGKNYDKNVEFMSIPFLNNIYILKSQADMIHKGRQYAFFPTNKRIGKIQSECYRRGGTSIGSHHCQEDLLDKIHLVVPMPGKLRNYVRRSWKTRETYTTRKAQRRQRSRRSRNK